MAKEKSGQGNGGPSGPAAAPSLPPGVKLLRSLAGHESVVLSVAFHPQRETLASGSADKTVKLWKATTGKLLRTLEGHQDWVNSVTFDPPGRTLASGCNDNTIKLWDATSGKLLRTLERHENEVYSVAFDPPGRMLASGSADNTVKLWEASSGKFLCTLVGHRHYVYSVAFDPPGRTVASGSWDNTVTLCEATSGKLLRTLNGHLDWVRSVAFDPPGRTLASGSLDNTVKLWEATSGKLLRTLEGHTGEVHIVVFSPDGRLLASKSRDHTIRLWSCETWETVAVIPEPTRLDRWIPALAFHPTLPLLATAGSEPDTPERKRCRLIHIWELDYDVLLGRAPAKTAHLKTAKVVLVGDTGVGKSAMAERLVHNQFVKTDSTHARRALLLESEQVDGGHGTVLHRDTVLWDLAGQPAYRLVHQLSMDDAAVACVLFDARSETNPFEGAAYWAEVLKQARTVVQLKSLLVAARTDVGGLPASLDRIKEFAAKHGFCEVFQTSAKTGEGCSELLAAIKQAIPWDDLPAVSTPHELAALREFIARLKGIGDPRTCSPLPASGRGAGGEGMQESRDRTASTESPSPPAPLPEAGRGEHVLGLPRVLGLPQLLRIADLQQRFAVETGLDIPPEKFVAYLQRMEDCDEIDLLVFHSTGEPPRPDDMVLLDPTRVDAYASALLVAAKDEPDGPGHLLESHIRDGRFKLERSERLADEQHERHVLWYVMENLFQRELALREPIGGQDYAVFPAQCTLPLKFPGAAAFGVALGLSGPVRGIYATLIAQLAHYASFHKREFFEDAAAYHTDAGKRCLVRLRDNGNGSGELEVSFDNGLPWNVRQGFLEFVEKHVEAKAVPGSLTKRHAHHCEHCGQPFDDAVVRSRLQASRPDLLCPYCDERTPLVNLLVPATAESRLVVATMTANARAGRQRITAEWVIKAKVAQGKYDVFLSHNSRDKDAVEAIARRLKRVGLRPWLDKWDLSPGDALADKLEWAIQNIPCAVLFFGPADVGKWHILELRAYLERWASGDARMIPVILPDAPREPAIPLFVRQTLWVDMRNWQSPTSDAFARLQCGILGRAPGDSPKGLSARDVWEWQEGEDADAN